MVSELDAFYYQRPILWLGLSHLLRFLRRTLPSCFRSIHFLHLPTHMLYPNNYKPDTDYCASYKSLRGRFFVCYSFYYSYNCKLDFSFDVYLSMVLADHSRTCRTMFIGIIPGHAPRATTLRISALREMKASAELYCGIF